MCIPAAPQAKTIARSNDMAAVKDAHGILSMVPKRVHVETKVEEREAPLPTRNRCMMSVKFDGNTHAELFPARFATSLMVHTP